MRTGQPIIGRPAWYDRNPSSIMLSWDGIVTPHGATERWSYTVPAGKKAMVEALQCAVRRVTTATNPGPAWMRVYVKPAGASEQTLLLAFLSTTDNTVGSRMECSIGASLTLFPGDQIRAVSFDLSDSGTILYLASAKLTLFDA